MITYIQALREFEQLVEEAGPDFRYTPFTYGSDDDDDMRCLYVHPTEHDEGGQATGYTPGCIVGHWLHRFHDVPLDALTYPCSNADQVIIRLTRMGLLPEVEYPVRTLASQVQMKQDQGQTWGEALRYAKAKVAVGEAP